MREEASLVVSKEDEILNELTGEQNYIVQFIKLVTKDREEALDFLSKGDFSWNEKYSAKEVLETLIKKGLLTKDDIYKKELREELEKGGAYIEAASRLQFYPTDYQETMLSVSSLKLKTKTGYRQRLNDKQKDLLRKIRTEHQEKIQGDSPIQIIEKMDDTELYIKLVEKRRFDIVKEAFILDYSEFDTDSILVADFFGGDGNWLNCFKSLDNKITRHVKTLYNEIEINKYNEHKNSFNFAFNSPAEELLPKLNDFDIKPSVILFNPPYGNAIGERNAKFFFKLMETNNVIARDTLIICALNEKDIRDMMEVLIRYRVKSIKRFSNDVEFKRLGQYLIELKGEVFSRDTELRNKARIEEVLENKSTERVIETFVETKTIGADVDKRLEELEASMDGFKYTPPNELKNYIFDNIIHSQKEETIYMPKKPSYEEICTLISNGKLNNKFIDNNGNTLYVCGVNEKYVETLNDEEEGKRIEREIYSTSIAIVDENRRYKLLSDFSN